MLSHWTQHDVTVNGLRLHYYRTGHGGKHPVVLVHGFSDNGLCWTPVAHDLESEYDVIMPDMVAHGLSARARPGGKLDMAADLAGIIRALGLKRPVIAGHSMGGMVAYQTGVRFPELVGALILEDPPWWLFQPAPTPSSGQSLENPIVAWAKDLPNHTLEELLVGYRRDHPAWPEALLRAMCESKKQLDPTFVDTLAGRMHSPEGNWLTTIHNITQPLLIITANPELGGIVTPEVVTKVRELNPKVTIVNIPDVGHLIRFDNHPAFMGAFREFLELKIKGICCPGI
jgi:N-formylmaleamate deformylase